MSGTLAWGILGTGAIAGVFARGLRESQTGRLVAVGSRAEASAERFGEEHEAPHRHGSYDALLADDAVETVYIATPHPMHAKWAIRAAEAGKHVLCEKPIALNHAEAMAVVEAARANDVFLMEAFMYRCHPQTARLVDLIRSGAIGEVRAIEASFGFDFSFDRSSRLLSQELGGGGILDVGCYPVSMARLIAGAAAGMDFDEPAEVNGAAHIGEVSRVDECAVASMKFPGGIVAQLATAVQVNLENVVRVFGREGWIHLPNPWLPGRDGRSATILLHRGGDTDPEEIVVESEVGLYALEADVVAANIEKRQAPPPAMTWQDSLGNTKTLDRWREAIGLVYDAERPDAQTRPVSGRPPSVRQDHTMRFGEVAGLEMPVARLVMGADNQSTMPHAAVMFDDYFRRGGNCFDTAFIYGGGLCEELLGHWMKSRGVRDQVAIIGKAAHTPDNRPDYLAEQLAVSLDRLQTDYVDLFMAHRDNRAVPVDEWVDAFNRLIDAGMVRAYGVSNWDLERVGAANDYARANGLPCVAGVSNNFSLARMMAPVWPGCIAASDVESRKWLAAAQIPLFAWSSQARGFFTERASPDDRSDEELVRCWYSDDNFRRRERAGQLADRRGVLPIQVALAYVLHQPFPTFALIGPRSIDETRSSFRALDLELTAEEVRWLDLDE